MAQIQSCAGSEEVCVCVSVRLSLSKDLVKQNGCNE